MKPSANQHHLIFVFNTSGNIEFLIFTKIRTLCTLQDKEATTPDSKVLN